MHDPTKGARVLEIEIEPECTEPVTYTEYTPPKPSRPINTDPEEISLERFRSGYRLVRLVVMVIAGVYFAGVTYGLIMTWASHPATMDIKEFSLEVVRLLIPPLTFILGFMFGANEKE
ncbi:MAG: hypothetical protein FWC93_02150 [Defluviitaleaceae bacterium]|nr:hypothetical protein [Defluviitaleaceae bacterium]